MMDFISAFRQSRYESEFFNVEEDDWWVMVRFDGSSHLKVLMMAFAWC